MVEPAGPPPIIPTWKSESPIELSSLWPPVIVGWTSAYRLQKLIAQGAAQLICDHFLSLRVGVPVPLGDRYTPNVLVVEPIVEIYSGETSSRSQPEILPPSVLHALPLGNTNPWQKVSTCADSAATQTNRALYHLAEAITPATGSCQEDAARRTRFICSRMPEESSGMTRGGK